MEKLTQEIIVAALVNINGFSEKEAIEQAPQCVGHEFENDIKKILQKRIGEVVRFTTQMSKLEKGCAPSVSLMDTRIDIAKKAIDKFNN